MATDSKVQSVAADDAGEHQKLKKLGKYVIKRRLGAGGMGTVFLAEDSELQRTVALKVLPKERAANPKLVQRFKSEGKAAAKLEHDNIVKVYEAGEINGFLYIALEYVEGTNVEDLVRKRTFLPVKRTIDIVRQVALALQHAHEKGIVHRDIKPSNLMIRQDGLVKLADMGLARAIDDTTDTNITQPGMTVGTVDYMAPEQGRDSKLADIRSDIYSLGCTWYHMLTGTPPFTEGSVTGKMGAHALKPAPDPRTVNENVPEAMVAVINRMMAKDPKDRYQTPQELLADLKQNMLGRQSVRPDVLAGLAESESSWEQPAFPEQDAGTTDGNEAKTAADQAAPSKRDTARAAKSKRRGKEDKGRERSRRPPRTKPARQAEGKSRELPPRSANPQKLGMSQSKLDLDRLRVLVIVFIGVCVLGGVGWAVSRMNSSMNDFGSDGTLNPFRPGVAESEPHGAAEAGPAATLDGDPPPVVPVTDGSDGTPATQLNEYQRIDLFAGADGEVDVPGWLVEARDGLDDSLTRLVVSLEGDGTADQPTIADALEQLPAAGGVIELHGPGPFPLPPLTIENVSRLAIRARDGDRPVVVMDAAGSGTRSEWLAFHGDVLEISGVHLIVSGRSLAANAPAIHVQSGTLLMRASSLTVTDPTGPTTGVLLGARDSAGANCLLENSFLRGSQLTSVRIASTAVNVVCGNSLLVSGGAAAIAVSPDEVPARADDDAKQSAAVSLFASAVFSGGSAFEVSTDDPNRTPLVELRGRRTVFAAGSRQAVWMRVSDWPETDDGSLSGGRAAGLAWTGDQCSLLGWDSLVEFLPARRNEPILIRDRDTWGSFWNAAAESNSFVAGDFGPDVVAADSVTPKPLTDRIEAFFVDADADRTAFDLDPDTLPLLPESLIDRIRAGHARPRLPSQFAVTGRRAVEFDLARGAFLNDFLNSSDCRDGDIVQLTGSGSQIRPIVLRNKSVRLVFPGGESAVSIRPVTTSVGERPPALIRVDGGSIDLVNADLTIPSSGRPYPLRVLQVIDGSFTLDGCIFRGQFREGAEDVPVIEWTRSSSGEQQFASIRNSLIAGKFQTLSADLSNRLLECENSIFTSVGDVFDLSIGEIPQSGYAVFSDCTFSPGRSAFRVRPDPDAQLAPINCFVERCVFAPPPESTPTGPVALTHPESAPADGTIVWWESHNGFAPQFRRYHQPLDSTSGADQDLQKDWVNLWGGEHVRDPLTGRTAVLLVSGLPEPDRVEPADYSLAESCAARSWGPGGVAIGARVGEIGPSGQESEPDSPATPRSPQRSRNDPGF